MSYLTTSQEHYLGLQNVPKMQQPRPEPVIEKPILWATKQVAEVDPYYNQYQGDLEQPPPELPNQGSPRQNLSIGGYNASLTTQDIEGARPSKFKNRNGRKRHGFYPDALQHIENLHLKDKYGNSPDALAIQHQHVTGQIYANQETQAQAVREVVLKNRDNNSMMQAEYLDSKVRRMAERSSMPDREQINRSLMASATFVNDRDPIVVRGTVDRNAASIGNQFDLHRGNYTQKYSQASAVVGHQSLQNLPPILQKPATRFGLSPQRLKAENFKAQQALSKMEKEYTRNSQQFEPEFYSVRDSSMNTNALQQKIREHNRGPSAFEYNSHSQIPDKPQFMGGTPQSVSSKLNDPYIRSQANQKMSTPVPQWSSIGPASYPVQVAKYGNTLNNAQIISNQGYRGQKVTSYQY